MFKKVLIAEDMDSINVAVAGVLKDLEVPVVEHAQYCDKAWLLAKRALLDGEPFDLLISDLSFKKDHQKEKIQSGEELVAKLRQENPDLKIIVNSVEDHPQIVKALLDSGNLDAYVCKDRNGMNELKDAILDVRENKKYVSPRIAQCLEQKNLLVLNDFEINLLTSVANGYTQKQIEEDFKKRNISPSSKSAIEKRLKELREEFGANTTAHLIGIVKDLRLI